MDTLNSIDLWESDWKQIAQFIKGMLTQATLDDKISAQGGGIQSHPKVQDNIMKEQQKKLSVVKKLTSNNLLRDSRSSILTDFNKDNFDTVCNFVVEMINKLWADMSTE